MKVSFIQMAIREAEPEQNKKKVSELLEKAVHDAPDVIVLPEMWNTGHALKQLVDIADINGKEAIRDLRNFTKKHHVNLVVGSVATAKENHFFNTTHVFNREGQVIVDYDKVHLFGLMVEDEYLQAGNKESVFELDDAKAASVICYDTCLPEWVRTLMSSGAKALFVVAEWPKECVEQWKILLRVRAAENQVFVTTVNRTGDGISDHFSGHPLVIDPSGKIALQVPDNQEGILMAELDLIEVEEIRGYIPVFADRKPDLYH